MPITADFIDELRKRFRGDIRMDVGSRVLYSTDASIYQIEPLGVVLPRDRDDLQAAVEAAAKYRIPILARGAGTSLAGQAIGPALIIDCSRWLDRIIEINAEEATATVEPGVILSTLNKAVSPHGLMFGPDPASAERATMGGVVGNNATGAHSILYGMTADHLICADVVMADGSLAKMGELSIDSQVKEVGNALLSEFYKSALDIRRYCAEEIKDHYPRTWRNSAGYRLNYLLPWTASKPPLWGEGQTRAGKDLARETEYPPAKDSTINLAHLLAGSEGTLAVLKSVTVRLVKKPKYTALAVLAYPSVAEACDDVVRLLAQAPTAIELIPGMLIQLARGVAGYATQLGWIRGDPAALLVVEFSGDNPDDVSWRAQGCGETIRVANTTREQNQIWAIRKAGLGLLDSAHSATRPIAFIEDCAIPIEHLGEFVREVEKILATEETQAAFYAHASAGCLHIRPMIDLRTKRGRESLRSISRAVMLLTLSLGGAMSSEHGDGLARSEWLGETYGAKIMEAMDSLKKAADPQRILNPGKIIDAPAMDDQLRVFSLHQSQAWKSRLDFSRAGGLERAIEQCNGQGVCRKDTGVMCPSFQATREEKNSTRGRANLLRSLISLKTIQETRLNDRPFLELSEATHEALDLCLACKGCKAECPSGVDMAKLKFAFEAEYFKTHQRPLSDYLFGYFDVTARLLTPVAPLTNLITRNPTLRKAIAATTGLSSERPFPRFSRKRTKPSSEKGEKDLSVFFLSDSYTHHIEPSVEQAAFDVLSSLRINVIVIPTLGAGASMLSKSFISAARKRALKVLDFLTRVDPQCNLDVVGMEPPEIYCFKNDYADLIPERKEEIALRTRKVWLLDEFLIRLMGERTQLPFAQKEQSAERVLLHPHCHQRAEAPAPDGLPNGTEASVELLRQCGYEVELIDAGCCGMAGTFGYESRHYELSQKVAELKLFPEIRKAMDDQNMGKRPITIASTGSACRLQIEQGTSFRAKHTIELVLASIIEK